MLDTHLADLLSTDRRERDDDFFFAEVTAVGDGARYAAKPSDTAALEPTQRDTAGHSGRRTSDSRVARVPRPNLPKALMPKRGPVGRPRRSSVLLWWPKTVPTS